MKIVGWQQSRSAFPTECIKILMNPETSFLCGLLELQYGQKVQKKLQRIAQKVPWAQGWPADKQAFWNAEAFMLSRKIGKETRERIRKELQPLAKGRNLDLGCGAYSYIPSVGFDVSPKMLELNDNCYEKIPGELEEKLPFKDKSFDSVTAVFVLNYVQNYKQLLKEMHRVLKPKGKVVIVGAKDTNRWQKQKQVQAFRSRRWQQIMEKERFEVERYEREGIWLLKGNRRSWLASR